MARKAYALVRKDQPEQTRAGYEIASASCDAFCGSLGKRGIC